MIVKWSKIHEVVFNRGRRGTSPQNARSRTSSEFHLPPTSLLLPACPKRCRAQTFTRLVTGPVALSLLRMPTSRSKYNGYDRLHMRNDTVKWSHARVTGSILGTILGS
jgi:hypothetical protein